MSKADMQEIRRTEEERERAVLVGVQRREDRGFLGEEPLEELSRLAETAGAVVLDRVVQTRGEISVRAYLGRGKIAELAERAQELEANLVITDDDLSPAQEKHLADDLGVRVIDRSELILDIFAQRAQTSVAKAQVELAQLQYMLPRLPHLWEHLSRLGGGIGTRGPGETQLEVDRRRVRDRITRLKRTLEKVELDWKVQRRAARENFTVALVGYTNSGKSTLMNALTHAGVGTGDMLFETVETTTRVWELEIPVRALLSDTVGFIRRIPHHLIASFHATLGEVREADLLLHVADAHDIDLERNIRTVEGVLEEIGAGDKPTILALNKTDLLTDELELSRFAIKYPGAVAISAWMGGGLDELKRVVLAEWEKREVEALVTLPIGESRALAYLYRHGRVDGCETERERLRVTLRIAPRWLGKLLQETEGAEWERVEKTNGRGRE